MWQISDVFCNHWKLMNWWNLLGTQQPINNLMGQVFLSIFTTTCAFKASVKMINHWPDFPLVFRSKENDSLLKNCGTKFSLAQKGRQLVRAPCREYLQLKWEFRERFLSRRVFHCPGLNFDHHFYSHSSVAVTSAVHLLPLVTTRCCCCVISQYFEQ